MCFVAIARLCCFVKILGSLGHHPSKQGTQRQDRKDACACERKVMAITKAPCICVETVKCSSLGLINEELVKWCSLAGYTIAQEDALKIGFLFCYYRKKKRLHCAPCTQILLLSPSLDWVVEIVPRRRMHLYG
jgi:hypothetical protein